MAKICRFFEKVLFAVSLSLAIVLAYSASSMAHFQMILSSDDIIEEGESNEIDLQIIFTHPAEAHYTEHGKTAKFGVFTRRKHKDPPMGLRISSFMGKVLEE